MNDLAQQRAQQSAAQLYPSAWETSYFAGCDVTITPMFAHSQIIFCLMTQGILLLMVAVCSTSWYCYVCGCVQYMISYVSPDTPSSEAELSSLISNAKSAGYTSISAKKKLLRAKGNFLSLKKNQFEFRRKNNCERWRLNSAIRSLWQSATEWISFCNPVFFTTRPLLSSVFDLFFRLSAVLQCILRGRACPLE